MSYCLGRIDAYITVTLTTALLVRLYSKTDGTFHS